MPRQDLVAYAALAAIHGGAVRLPHTKPLKIKKCRECAKDHTHNNDWCSPECCRTYRSKKS